MMKKASLIVHISEDGEVIHVKNVDLTDVVYNDPKNRTMLGARLFTPNGCCWVKTPAGWQCTTC